MATHLKLQRRLDTAHADTLAGSLKDAQGQDLALDASAVDLLGARCLEVLLSAVAIWRGAGQAVTLVSPSDDFLGDLALFGLTPDTLMTERAA